MNKIRRALISVSDKTGIIKFAQALVDLGIDIISTGSTAQLLIKEKIPVTEIAEYTGFPEMLDGRLKTLHPKIYGGILSRRDSSKHLAEMAEQGIGPIDLVCVNLYPFEAKIAEPDCVLEEAIEHIDIGGPAMVRAAAKNFDHVAVVTDLKDYPSVMKEIQTNGGLLTLNTRRTLAQKAFSYTAAYDGAISNYLTAVTDEGEKMAYPQCLNLQFVKVQDMRYGENPHQSAAFYRDLDPPLGSLATYKQYQGKSLSYNNIADADTAWECVKQFEVPACVIVKHANPCGIAIAKDSCTAYQLAFSTDPSSAFGGIIAFNKEVDENTVKIISEQFFEVLIAPSYTAAALTELAKKERVRVLEVTIDRMQNHFDLKRIGGGLLVQTPDSYTLEKANLQVVSQTPIKPPQLQDLLFAWDIVKFLKSNAVVFCNQGQTLGIGAGQMSRIDSIRIGIIKAKAAGFSLEGSVCASDAFLPFRDSVDEIAMHGVSSIIQPGGSLRDKEIIAAANEHHIGMVLTGVRHFRH